MTAGEQVWTLVFLFFHKFGYCESIPENWITQQANKLGFWRSPFGCEVFTGKASSLLVTQHHKLQLPQTQLTSRRYLHCLILQIFIYLITFNYKFQEHSNHSFLPFPMVFNIRDFDEGIEMNIFKVFLEGMPIGKIFVGKNSGSINQNFICA